MGLHTSRKESNLFRSCQNRAILIGLDGSIEELHLTPNMRPVCIFLPIYDEILGHMHQGPSSAQWFEVSLVYNVRKFVYEKDTEGGVPVYKEVSL